MHLKRNLMNKTWPIPRKGTKYIAKPRFAARNSISLVFLLRDILKIAKTRKEVVHILKTNEVKVNHRVIKDPKYPLQVFDTLSLGKLNKNYRLVIESGKFKLKEISEKDSEVKIVKIIGKKVLDGKKIQINLQDGNNFLFDKEFSLGDSVVLNQKKNKIEKILSLKKGAKVEVISGKHAGETGKLEEVLQFKRKKYCKIKLKDKEVELPRETLLVIE